MAHHILRKISLSIGGLVLSTALLAQDFSGLHSGNWAGVHSLHINPANVVDNRFSVDVNVFSINSFFGNDYIGMKKDPVFDTDLFSVTDFDDQYLTRDTSGSPKNMTFSTRVMLPSFMMNITKKDAIGLSVNHRAIFNIDEVTQDITELIYNGLTQGDLNLDFAGSYGSVNGASWTEVGLHYGRVIIDNNQHFLKGGITLKAMLGANAAYATIRDFNFRFNDLDTIEYLAGDVFYGHTENLINEGGYSPLSVAGFGVGVDLGFVYEWRPNYMRYKYNMDGEENLWRKDKEKYKLRIGVALNDLGSIRFTKVPGSSDYSANVQNVGLDFFEGVENISDLTNRLNVLPGMTQVNTGNQSFNMDLPLALTTTIDWQIKDGWFLNVTPVIAFNQGTSDQQRLHTVNSITIVPRYEHPWFGAYMPISWNQLTNFNWGLSFRAGPIVFGSGSLFSWLIREHSYGADFFVGAKVPIPHRSPRDKDKDGVSDKRDNCKEVAGVWEFKGCPDTDLDGIPDATDECPFEAGPAEFNGCPDTDGDGVQDKIDACPNEAGVKELAGCPDKDSDGVTDAEDECPDVKGLAMFKGCPDTDGDSIQDKLDRCPTLPGPAESFGCPDTDGDGIFDDKDLCPSEPGLPELDGCPFRDSDGDGIKDVDDQCPNQAGPPENGGCPYADTDGDGIIDLEDKCPKTPGVKEENGCPPIAKEDKEVLQQAFDNLEFATGKAIISTSSYSSLDKLAEVLQKKPEYKLLIEGHTDNVGRRSSNMTLSKNRANAVKLYLQKKGIAGDRIITQHYGPDKPIGDNATEEGRQKNRRVEMTVIFD